MYGLVNRALEEMITSSHGEQMWEAICRDAGVDEPVFLATEGYDDRITYELVAAVSKRLDCTAADVLQQFGKWWVLKTATDNYAHLLKAGGTSLREFLLNLPNFHNRIILVLPALHPPMFSCSNVEECSLWLHYSSTRAGLTPFVIGLINGLAEMFATPVDIALLQSREAGADHDVFSLRWSPTSH